MRHLCPWFAVMLASFILCGTAPAEPDRKPRLVIVISIDQFRADYLTRFDTYYLPAKSRDGVGGFRYLKETGAWFRDAHLAHIPTETGPGHATLLTGSAPCLNGIVGNSYFDRQSGKLRYCVQDDAVEPVGGGSGKSPRGLRVSTVGDELKLATAGSAKVVSLAFKDRAAILMAGHSADAAVWYDIDSGKWVTSSWYAKGNSIPSWVQSLNDRKLVDTYAGKVWEPLLPADSYVLCKHAPGQEPAESGSLFSHKLPASAGDNRALYRAFLSSGLANDYVELAAEAAISAENLGQDDVCDMLCIGFSSNDYVGHRYGPNSPEVMDISVRTDRALARLLNYAAKNVPGGLSNVMIVLSADHGVAPIPEEAARLGLSAARQPSKAVREAVEASLDSKYGSADWVSADDPHLYLNQNTVTEKNLDMSEVERTAQTAAMAVKGVYCAFTRTQILQGDLPPWDWTKLVANGFHPKLSGDVIVILDPNWLLGDVPVGTSHGAPWPYDTHVPLILSGPGVTGGSFFSRVSIMDLAPTLCQLLSLEYPSGCLGRPLTDALTRD